MKNKPSPLLMSVLLTAFSKNQISIALAAFGMLTATASIGQIVVAPASLNVQVNDNETKVNQLPAVVVTAAALGANAAALPSNIVEGEALTLQKGKGLGETLARELGVSATQFGANASRPIIRGLDGDRIKVLYNGGNSHDVSDLSFDHATPIDPLVIERIEVLRGPATLLYGGGAVGGVVNAIDNRIPKVEVDDGITGAIELHGATGSKEVSSSAILETSLNKSKDWAIHLDGFKRHSSSTRVPIGLACDVQGITVIQNKVCNTDLEAKGGAIGLSRLWSQGFVGASLSTYNSVYGTPAEDEVTIAMKSHRVSLHGEQRNLDGLFTKINVQLNRTRYTHTERDAGIPATIFNKNGSDGRIELSQRETHWNNGNTLTGTVGLSMDSSQFEALGNEAFIPINSVKNSALFTIQTLKTSWGSMAVGARMEQVNIVSDGGNQTDYAGIYKFLPDIKHFSPTNISMSGIYKISPNTQITGVLSSSERAPTSAELYANGAHIASGSYEQGNSRLKIERSHNLDIGMQWTNNNATNSLKINGFYNRFNNYINMANSGKLIGADGELNPIDADGNGVADSSGESVYALYQAQPIRAQFYGVEIQGKMRLNPIIGADVAAYRWDIDAKFDTLRANNTDTGEALPRISPRRITVGTDLAYTNWTTRAELAHNFRQNHIPMNDALGATPSYSMVNLSLSYRNKQSSDAALWFVKLDNALNTLAYNASTVDTVRGKAPLAGRSLKVGVQYLF